MKKIICVHLYNDYSGSPLVLSTAIKSFIQKGHQVTILTSKETEGFLSNIEGAQYDFFNYRFRENKLVRLFALLWSQFIIFLKVFNNSNSTTIVYTNTLLPFGASIAGKLKGLKVIYHMHETTVNPPILKSFLKKVATFCAGEAIYVSKFLMEQEPLKGVPSRVIYNSLSKEFVQKAEQHLSKNNFKPNTFTVLMLCSLKEYKGVNEYVKLATTLPEYRFILVLNTQQAAINEYFHNTELPNNLVIFPAQKNVHSFYQEAHLVLNLSHPEKWVETFGMTLLEAMSYGLPVIAPPVGGPVELVLDNYNGFKVDQREIHVLKDKIQAIFRSENFYKELSKNAKQFAGKFSEKQFGMELVQVTG